jgi:hypothetical protein
MKRIECKCRRGEVRIKGWSTKAKIRLEETNPTSILNHFLLNTKYEESVFDEVNHDNHIQIEDAQNNINST